MINDDDEPVYRVRVREELNDLRNKMEKLDDSLSQSIQPTKSEHTLLSMQLPIMRLYARILEKRIALWDE